MGIQRILTLGHEYARYQAMLVGVIIDFPNPSYLENMLNKLNISMEGDLPGFTIHIVGGGEWSLLFDIFKYNYTSRGFNF